MAKAKENNREISAITDILILVMNDLNFDESLGKFVNTGSDAISMSREIYDSIRSYINVQKKDKKIAIQNYILSNVLDDMEFDGNQYADKGTYCLSMSPREFSLLISRVKFLIEKYYGN